MAFNFNGIWGVFIVLGALFVVYYIYNIIRGKNKSDEDPESTFDPTNWAYFENPKLTGTTKGGKKRKRKLRRKQRLR